MKKKLILGVGLGLALGVATAFAIPESRYPILELLHAARLFNGRPFGHWVASVKDTDPNVRRQAMLSLGDAGLATDPALDETEVQVAIAALIEGIGDNDGFVRKCAATSFLIYPKETPVSQAHSSIRNLSGALQDKEVIVRRAAVRGLWQAGAVAKEEGGVGMLTHALADKDDFVRAYAARALARIGPGAKDAVPTVLTHLREDKDRDVRKLCAKTLGLIGPQAIGPLLPETVEALTQGLKGEPTGLREYSARSLGQLGAVDAIPALRKASSDREASVRSAAQESLKLLEKTATSVKIP